MLTSLTKLLQSTNQAQYIYLIQQLFTLLFNNIKNVMKLLTQLKVLRDIVNTTKIKLTTNK